MSAPIPFAPLAVEVWPSTINGRRVGSGDGVQTSADSESASASSDSNVHVEWQNPPPGLTAVVLAAFAEVAFAFAAFAVEMAVTGRNRVAAVLALEEVEVVANDVDFASGGSGSMACRDTTSTNASANTCCATSARR